MLKGFYLTLMVGPVVPVPAPKALMDSLSSVQVTTSSGQRSGFQLTFTLSLRSPLHTVFLLSGGGLIPIIRVILIATVNGKAQLLSSGAKAAYGYDAKTGKELWKVTHLDYSSAPRPIFARLHSISLRRRRTRCVETPCFHHQTQPREW